MSICFHQAMHLTKRQETGRVASSAAPAREALPKKPTLFERAVMRDSRLLVFELVNDCTGEHQTMCTMSEFLLRAIKAEFELPDTEYGDSEAIRIALTTQAQTFHFSKVKALQFFPKKMDAEALRIARHRLSKVPRMELIGAMQEAKDEVFIERRKSFFESGQALIEIGILPTYLCSGGYLLWIGSKDLEPADLERLKEWKRTHPDANYLGFEGY
ncbi:MAG: hypothetical protein K2Z81_10600 [Cyanobacteria bacterium]|nr:hypothetical protein [Cyanobacteriota bacterium]